MTYTIRYTESNNPNKPPITVQDQSLDTTTPITLVGQGYSGYAPVFATDLLHLLENFANPTAPAQPVQGQLWYDNVNNLLKVYDGAGTWNPAGAIKKSLNRNPPASANIGDVWVSTDTSQLYVWSGSSWVLVGPQYSSNSNTGPQAEEIVDTNNLSHYVITFYSNNNKVAIISQDSFTPKQTLAGFSAINKGVNLYTVANSLDPANGTTAGVWGTASSSNGLLVNNKVISSANFLTTEGTTNTTNTVLNVRNNDGLKVGSDLSFQIKTTGTGTVFNSINTNNSIAFQLTNNLNVSNTVVQINANGYVGVNNPNPATALDVVGTIQASTGVNVTGTTNSTSPITGSITTTGGVGIAQDLFVGGNTNVAGKITVGNLGGVAIQPSASAQYDIGTPLSQFRNIYAQNFVGDFSGTFAGYFTGSVDGSATQLANPTIFSLAGDVTSNSINFNGATLNGTATFNTTLSSAFITNKTAATDSSTLTSAFPDSLVVYQSSSQSLVKMTKTTFFNHVPLVPIGSIFPFAGPAAKIPAGYLLCDGSEILQQTYSALYQIIGYTYSSGSPSNLLGAATFKLPDLRGRFPLGADNMNNNITVPSSGNANNLISTVSANANRVPDTTADNIGSGSESFTSPGRATVTLSTSQLPQHTHNLKSTGNSQYYAVGDTSTASDSDTATRAGYGITPTGINRGLANAGPVLNTTTNSTLTGQAVNIMNPYLTINYIIYTGVGI
jgi:microcystin-dependent protein